MRSVLHHVSTSTCPFDDRYHAQASQNMHNNDIPCISWGGKIFVDAAIIANSQ